ncbi:MAG: hypothetical protein ACXVYY_17225, partial [Oryzihumus sp.]
MTVLRIRQPDDDVTLRDWQHVHNATIPAHQLSLEEVREQAGRNRAQARVRAEGAVRPAGREHPVDR